jgi:hypothetical protein
MDHGERVAARLAELAHDLDWLAAEQLDRSPVPDSDPPLRPSLMSSEDLSDAARQVRSAARIVLAHSGGWGMLINELAGQSHEELPTPGEDVES